MFLCKFSSEYYTVTETELCATQCLVNRLRQFNYVFCFIGSLNLDEIKVDVTTIDTTNELLNLFTNYAMK